MKTDLDKQKKISNKECLKRIKSCLEKEGFLRDVTSVCNPAELTELAGKIEFGCCNYCRYETKLEPDEDWDCNCSLRQVVR